MSGEDGVQPEERLSDIRDGNATGAPLQRSYWPVALALLGLVVAMLGAAFILNRQLRPPVGIQPTSGSAPPARVEIPSSVVTATTVIENPTPVTQATAQLGAAASPPAETSVPTTGPVGLSTPELTDQQVVEQAYLRYWEVYREALLQLDTSRIPEVAADEELQRIHEEVEGFRHRGQAVRATVTHRYFVFDVTEREAKIHDEIFDRSFMVDPVTKEPSRGPDSGSLVKDTYFLKKMDGVWKVIKSVRQEG